MNTINSTAIKTAAQQVWMLDFSGETVETETHDAVELPARDRDGKFAPKFEKPVSKKQAWKKLEASSKKQSRAAAMLSEMESW